MTKSKKLVALLVVVAMLFTFVSIIAACGKTHECADPCATCGLCTTQCGEKECEEKCQGHGTPQPGPTPHTCTSKCPTCQKCTNASCQETACKEKCPSHQQQGGSHTCTSKCSECGKCTNATCTDAACAQKCSGHKGDENCEHANIVLNKCQDCSKVFTVDEIFAALDALDTSKVDVMPGTYQLTGIVTAKTPRGNYIDIWFNVEGGSTTRNLEAYGIVDGDAKVEDIVVGARVTVSGTLKTHYKTQEFDAKCTVDAIAFPEYSITVEPYENATVSEIAKTARAGETISFTVQAAEGYKIAAVEVNDAEIDGEGSYSFVVTGNMKVVIKIVDNSAKVYEPVTFDATTKGYSNASEVSTVTAGTGDEQVTITFAKGSNSNASKWYDSGSAIRVYGGNTITVKAPTGLKIKKIVIGFGTGGDGNEITADGGTWSSPTWTGDAAQVVLTIGGTKGNVRVQTITITIGE